MSDLQTVKINGKDYVIKTVKIGGKDYVMVDERLRIFHEIYPNGSIETTVNIETEFLTYLATKSQAPVLAVRAVVTPDVSVPERFFTGHAYEVEGSTFINDGSALENCETSAVGRALAMLNIGLIGDVASFDEVANAQANKAKPIHHEHPNGAALTDEEWKSQRNNVAFTGGKNAGLAWCDLSNDVVKWASEQHKSEEKKMMARMEMDYRAFTNSSEGESNPLSESPVDNELPF
tara:strand:+ start:11868 stop:12569 length:702 start_codon:yes stop_codon:yes gene_type:complete